MSESKKTKGYDRLLKQYLEVCNQVMRQNRDRFPYSKIWQAGEQALSGRAVEFAVVDDEPKAHRCVKLESNRISDTAEADPKDDPPVMRISASYIEDVVAHPEKYIENPALIDWDWLKMRR